MVFLSWSRVRRFSKVLMPFFFSRTSPDPKHKASARFVRPRPNRARPGDFAPGEISSGLSGVVLGFSPRFENRDSVGSDAGDRYTGSGGLASLPPADLEGSQTAQLDDTVFQQAGLDGVQECIDEFLGVAGGDASFGKNRSHQIGLDDLGARHNFLCSLIRGRGTPTGDLSWDRKLLQMPSEAVFAPFSRVWPELTFVKRPLYICHMNYVTYFRVSTDAQGRSGLGLEAQRAQVASFIASRPGQVIGDYQEIETGKNDRRPQLGAALKQAKDSGATLLIAKIDRLSRNAGFIFNLKDSGVDFVAVDMPDANTLTVGIMALLAQQEREMISSRTKAALQAKKAQGAKLGAALVGCNFTAAGRRKSAQIRRADGLQRTETARSIAKDLRGEGRTLAHIADRLNKYELRAARGGFWGAKQVSRILSNGLASAHG